MDLATLGRIIKKARKAKAAARPKGNRLAKLRAALAKKKLAAKLKRRPSAKKIVAKKLLARLPPAKRKAVIAKAIAKNPALKKKLALAIVAKRMTERKEGTVTSPGATQEMVRPSNSPAVAVPPPAAAPIPDQEMETPAQAVEDEQNQAALEEEASAETDKEEAGEAATEEAAADMAETAEADAEEMSEETPEEAAEEAEETADDAAETVSESAGDLVLGFMSGVRKKLRRRSRFLHRAVKRAAPLAGEIERLSGGEIKAEHLLGAVKLIAKAKKGDKKAKKGIKAVTKLAAKKGPKQAKAKKATAKLKIAHKIMKKTGTAKGTGKKKLAIKAKKAPYSKKVVVRNTGLESYSAYQRGMAQIPGTARTHFGT